MTCYTLSFAGVIARFYLLMAVVLLAGFTGAWALALLALPIFLSCMLGVSFRTEGDLTPPAIVAEAEEAAAPSRAFADEAAAAADPEFRVLADGRLGGAEGLGAYAQHRGLLEDDGYGFGEGLTAEADRIAAVLPCTRTA